jgi:hypothetical protein
MARLRPAAFIGALSGFLVATAGVAVFPATAQLAAPFVCPGQSLVTKTTSFSGEPGSAGTETVVACVDAAGAQTEIGLLVMLVLTVELGLPCTAIAWWIHTQLAAKPEDDDD